MQRRQQQQRPRNDSQPLQRSQRTHLPPTPTLPPSPLLDALTPLLPLFHAFLSDHDAARLLRTPRATALALLPGYAFTGHIFKATSLASLRRLRDLHLTYQLRITQLALSERMRMQNLTLDAAPPHLSPISASFIALSLGQALQRRQGLGCPAMGGSERCGL